MRIRSLHRVTGRDLRHGKFNDFGALFRQAITKALRTVVSSAHSRSMMVEPRCPHPPGTGANIFGSEAVSISCWAWLTDTEPAMAPVLLDDGSAAAWLASGEVAGIGAQFAALVEERPVKGLL